MKFLEKLEVIERVDGLIRRKATGTPDELASRLGVSRSTVYELIECLQLLGAEINYCRNKKSFYYKTEMILKVGFIRGGRSFTGERSICF